MTAVSSAPPGWMSVSGSWPARMAPRVVAPSTGAGALGSEVITTRCRQAGLSSNAWTPSRAMGNSGVPSNTK